MDLGKTLIESNKTKTPGSWKKYSASLLLHGAIVGAAIGLSLTATEKVAAEEKPIPVYIQQAAAAPPPPPPPPAAHASSAPSHPKPQVQPIQQPVHQSFVAPTETPKEVPVPTTPSNGQTATTDDTSASNDNATDDAGVDGGVEGGVAGGVVGGTIGGEQGGVVGGQVGGVVGGTPGGVVGGTPGAPVAAAPAPAPPAPEPPSGPLRVGGDVKAPVVVQRVDPQYPEVARKSRVAGVVIIEAIIDKGGNVDHVRVIRGLPMGLSESAEAAVRRWKFRPGTLNGQPVDVIFNLTVVFTLGADAPSVSAKPKAHADRPSSPAPQPPAAAPAEPPAATPPEPPADGGTSTDASTSPQR